MNYKSVLITCIAIISCIGSVSAFSDFDKNHDGTVDEYESCMFEYSKGEYYCKAFTEDAQKAMWERYGNMGAIPSKAFGKDQEGTILIDDKYRKIEPITESVSSDASEFEESIQDIPKPLPKSIRDELYANISALPQNKRIPYLEMIYSKSEALMATKITGERRQLVVSLKAHIGNALSKYKIGY